MTIMLKCLAARPMAKVRLVCIPYAGAGAGVFQRWAEVLPATVEPYALQLPGREDRLDEPPVKDWPALINAGLHAINALPPSPFALLGHSLGAVIALELARAAEKQSNRPLIHFFCAARPWPGGHAAERPDFSSLDDDALFDAMEKYYGAAPPSFQNRQIRSLTAPCLRADLALLERHQWRPAPPLGSPMTVYAGKKDPITMSADLTLWRRETSARFDLVELDAGHFFLESHKDQMITDLAEKIMQ